MNTINKLTTALLEIFCIFLEDEGYFVSKKRIEKSLLIDKLSWTNDNVSYNLMLFDGRLPELENVNRNFTSFGKMAFERLLDNFSNKENYFSFEIYLNAYFETMGDEI